MNIIAKIAITLAAMICAAISNTVSYSQIFGKAIVFEGKEDEALGFWIVSGVGAVIALAFAVKAAQEERSAQMHWQKSALLAVAAAIVPAALIWFSALLGQISASTFLFGPMLWGYAAGCFLQPEKPQSRTNRKKKRG